MSGFHRLHTLRMENDAAGYALAELRPRFERLASRHENGSAPVALSVYQLFQTPKPVADRLATLLDIRPGSRLLEPSAGLGRLLDAVKPYSPAEIVAVELASSCAAELYRQNRESVTIKQRDFLTISPEEIGLFDAVIMNPPFHMRSDLRHVDHALRFLKPGGRLATVCLNGSQRQDRLGAMAAQWIDLGAGAFKESGTNVNTAIVVIESPLLATS